MQSSWVPKDSTQPKPHLQLNKNSPGLFGKPSLPGCHGILASHAHQLQQRPGAGLGLGLSSSTQSQEAVTASRLDTSSPRPGPGTAPRAPGGPCTPRTCVRTARASRPAERSSARPGGAPQAPRARRRRSPPPRHPAGTQPRTDLLSALRVPSAHGHWWPGRAAVTSPRRRAGRSG